MDNSIASVNGMEPKLALRCFRWNARTGFKITPNIRYLLRHTSGGQLKTHDTSQSRQITSSRGGISFHAQIHYCINTHTNNRCFHRPRGATYAEPDLSLQIFATFTLPANAPFRLEAPLDGVNLIPYLCGQKTGARHAIKKETTR
jgi:hypothetical protein